MKKILRFLPLVLLFLACEQGIIFHDIALEIELEEANVIGNINSIVKLQGNLYTQNGNVYAKALNTERGWEKINAPERIIALSSDDKNLYALKAGQTDDDGNNHTYQAYVLLDGTGAWKEVVGTKVETITEEGEIHENVIALFDNAVIGDATTTDGRNAYIRINEKVFLLDGESLGAEQTANGAGAETVAAANIASGDYFSNSRAFCSNGTDTLYTVSDETVEFSSDTTTWETSSVSVSDATVMIYASDKIYVGTKEGLEQITTFDANKKPTSISNLGANAEATTGEKEILSIGYFGDYDGNAIYAGAIEQYSTNDNGLWGFYPSRNNWNFE